MKKYLFFIFFVLFFTFLFSVEECTTAIIGVKKSGDGSLILWKNRDTSNTFNKVVFVKESPYSFLGVVNNFEESGRIVYGGINSVGFAIINSVAVNLEYRCGEQKDLEGMIMADALRTCRSVDDFELYINKNLGKNLGAQSNFGVIDGYGNGAIFEVSNHSYKRLNLKDFDEGYIINTNFSRSGKKNKGAGYVRFYEVKKLFEKRKKIDIPFLLFHVVCDLKNFFVTIPDKIKEENYWIDTVDSIDRSYTASAMIFKVYQNPSMIKYSTMWFIPGEPAFSVALPLWICGDVPEELRSGKKSPLSEISYKIKKVFRPETGGHLSHYLNYSLYLKSGIKEKIFGFERRVLSETKVFISEKPGRDEMRKFQRKISKNAYSFLKKVYNSLIKH